MYRMFLDDERFPADDGDWAIVRSFDEAVAHMEVHGCPVHIAFDHDLGDHHKTGYDVVKWMENKDLDNDLGWIPNNFTWYAHSRNPVGMENINRRLEALMKHKTKGTRS